MSNPFTLFKKQAELIFRPWVTSRAHEVIPIKTPKEYALLKDTDVEEITLTTKDKIKIHGWFHPIMKEGMPIFVYFPGNTGHLGDIGPELDENEHAPDENIRSEYRVETMRAMYDTGSGFLAINYRGYGNSEGKPTEKGLYQDARAAIEYLKHKGFKTEDMIFYGESLGTAVAIKMATEHRPAVLVMNAPFTSMVERAHDEYDYVPRFLLKWFLHYPFASIDRVKELDKDLPLVIMHGRKDTVTDIKHSRDLKAEALKQNMKNVKLREVPKGKHLPPPTRAIKEALAFFPNQAATQQQMSRT